MGDFISARFLNNEVATRNFLLRRNIESKWEDDDVVYHFGNTVPNWTKITAGSRIIFDRKENAGVVISGSAEIGTVSEVTGSDKPRELPIIAGVVKHVRPVMQSKLDRSFFSVCLDRLTPTERRYLRAMSKLGPGPHRSGLRLARHPSKKA